MVEIFLFLICCIGCIFAILRLKASKTFHEKLGSIYLLVGSITLAVTSIVGTVLQDASLFGVVVGQGIVSALTVTLIIVLFSYLICSFCLQIHSLFNYKRWDKEATPDVNAKIISFNSERVKYISNGAKYKTTVCFSDGFRYTTFKTDRKQGFFTYEISIDSEYIAEFAVYAHLTALNKLAKKGLYTFPIMEEPPESTLPPKVTSSHKPSISAKLWCCTCGREHQVYESSCVCGMKKSDILAMHNQEQQNDIPT